MSRSVRKVAVIGAGTMGAAIAAHAANAGLEVDLLDIAPSDSDDKNAVVKAGFDRMKKARPAALMSKSFADRIRLGNLDDDMERVSDADWIVEAIVEKIEPKQDFMSRIEKLAPDSAIVTSNTSGIPLNQVSEGRSESFRKRFLGTHFFNPPRYLKLLELIPTADTDPDVVERMRTVGERVLGKGCVVAKDTPNFIGNRIGSFAGMQSITYALENGYGVEEIDAITGPLIGNPKTAIFRLNDQVGLDIAVGVAENLVNAVPEDESLEHLKPHPVLRQMLERNLLGNKTGAGFYKRTQRDGQRVFDVIDLDSFEHHPPEEPKIPITKEAKKQGGLGARLRFLMQKADEDKHARYLRDTLLPYMAYASRKVPEISDTLEDVDHAMEWGFGHEAGPFRTWDLLGVRETAEQMKRLGIAVAPWVDEMLEADNESFYKEENGREVVYSPVNRTYEPVRQDPLALRLDDLREEGEVSRNDSASLVDLGDGVLCFEIHSRGNSIDGDVLEIGHEALNRLESEEWTGLVIGNDGNNFSVGANIGEIIMAVMSDQIDEVGERVDALHGLLMGFRHATKPVVAAPHGQTLGGGAEIALHADRIVAAGETYMGLVEAGVGLIPAGGGVKEMIRRNLTPAIAAAPSTPPLPFLQKVFESIAMAKVATSAVEAREMGFLDEEDRIILNADHLIHTAKQEVLDLADGYAPPARGRNVYASGKTAQAALEVGVKTLRWGHYATEYDGVIAGHLASVITGGGITLPQWVNEEYILGLEKDAFLELLKNEKTQKRIGAMLETGKPLRN